MKNKKLTPQEIADAIVLRACNKMDMPNIISESATGKQIDSNEIHQRFIKAAEKALNYINMRFGARQIFYTPITGAFSISMN